MKTASRIILSFLTVVIITVSVFLYWYIKIEDEETAIELDFNDEVLTVFDYNGFPSVKFSFSCSEFVKIKIVNNESETVDVDYFTKGDNVEAVLSLGLYEETIDGGTYNIQFYDSSNNNFRSVPISFNGENLEFSECSVYSWNHNGEKYITGLNLFVENDGDIPVYPDEIQIEGNNQAFKGFVLPDVILPNEKKSVDCVIFDKIIDDTNDFNIKLYNSNKKILDSVSFKNVVFTELKDRVFYNISDDVESITLPYPSFLHNYYQSQSRLNTDDYSVYVFDKYDDRYIELITEIISSYYPNESGFDFASNPEKINFMASFVQNIDYVSDYCEKNIEEYPKYPLETLFDNETGGGDCEDKSILAASILTSLDYDLALIKFPDHMGLGVSLGKNDIPDVDFFTSSYYYLEVSNSGQMENVSGDNVFQIGDIPVNYSASKFVDIFDISPRYVMNHYWKGNSISIFRNTPKGHFVKVSLVVENFGKSTAEDVEVQGIVFDNDSFFENNRGIFDHTIDISSIPAFGKKEVNLIVDDLNAGGDWYFKTRVKVDGASEDELKSDGTFSI